MTGGNGDPVPRPRDDGRRFPLSFRLNGVEVSAVVPPWARLIDVLRGPLGHRGAKEGCGEGMCGACTVMVDGRSANACLFPAMEVEGKEVVTVEGLAEPGGGLSILQEEFVENDLARLCMDIIVEESPDTTIAAQEETADLMEFGRNNPWMQANPQVMSASTGYYGQIP